MKYSNKVTINAPRDRVCESFSDPSKVGEWQDGFIGMEAVSGEKGQAGNVNLMKYDNNGRKMDLTETIEFNSLPDSFAATYTTPNFWSRAECTFSDTPDGGTHLVMETETKLSGIFMKVMGTLMPGMFKKQSQKMLDNLKAFVERT